MRGMEWEYLRRRSGGEGKEKNAVYSNIMPSRYNDDNVFSLSHPPRTPLSGPGPPFYEMELWKDKTFPSLSLQDFDCSFLLLV